jgi:hypothetical protein
MMDSGMPIRPALRADSDHRVGVATPLVVVLFGVFAAYAGVFALFAHGAESVWGAWAAGTYGVAALVAAWCWRRWPSVPLLVAILGALAVPAAILPVNWGATSEVRVVARAAAQWLSHGTPYLASGQLASWRSYDPYLPGMSLFGLPHALGLPGPLGDPLTWLALTTAGLLVAACRIAAPGATRRCAGCRRQALLRTMLLISVPVFALPMSLGVTDPPVIALLCLGLAWTAQSAHVHAAGTLRAIAAAPGERSGEGVAPRRRSRPLLAGVAIGAACALKATAWPALPVIVALLAVRDGRQAAARFTSSSLATFVALVALTAPELLTHPRTLWLNIVEYPLGLSHSPTKAASPLPGHLIASTGSLGHLVAIVLLVGAALALGASLLLRPPRNIRQASVRLAVGFVLMFLLAPDARFGYFAYPLGILLWLILTRSWSGSRSGRAGSSTLVAARRPVCEEREGGVAAVRAATRNAARGVRGRVVEAGVPEIRAWCKAVLPHLVR